jgi:hypothetical protein
LAAAGFDVVRTTSFVSLLLPAMVLQRFVIDRATQGDAAEAVATPRGLGRPLAAVMRCERALIQIGADLPVGGSLLVVARRRAETAA